MKKTIVISGASRGIGLGCVEFCIEKGYKVIGCSRSESPFSHADYTHFCVDVSDEGGVRAIAGQLQSHSVYGLLNCAGIASMNHCLLTPMQTVQNVLATNVAGTFLFVREFSRLMKRRNEGRIVNFGSVAVPLKLEGEAIYAASKAALVTLTEIMAKELAPFNITCNLIGPNPVQTNLIRAVPKDKIQAILEMQAIRRYGEVGDVTNVIDFFLKEESGFITGQTVYLGGV